MTVKISVGNWSMQQRAARAVRDEVFVTEQAIPVELEWDDMDAVSLHAVACNANGEPIGTGRLLPDGHIGRMAVSRAARGTGVGGLLLQALMQQARARGDAAVVLSAQAHALPFYQRHGFVPQGEPYMEAGISHVSMAHDFAG
ncbi:MAG: GNAT family N-acetyltransferase [Janthinobacterium lividum]